MENMLVIPRIKAPQFPEMVRLPLRSLLLPFLPNLDRSQIVNVMPEIGVLTLFPA